MVSIRHLDTIIGADQCSCLQLMSSAQTCAAREIPVSVKTGLRVSIFSHGMCPRVLIFIDWGFFSFISCIILFPLWSSCSCCECVSVHISHMFCILFHPGLLVMGLRCKMQDSRGGGAGAISPYTFFMISGSNTILYSTHIYGQTHILTWVFVRKHKCLYLLSNTKVRENRNKQESTETTNKH